MLPIGPLMTEHRLIEGMIALLKQEFTRLRENLARDPENPQVDVAFVDAAVDFIRIYADKTHHGKEEDILFAECAQKPLSPEDRHLLAELLADHGYGRRTTGGLLQAKEDYLKGDKTAVLEILEAMAALAEFYPRHIDKEDHHFFPASMKYFTPAEKDDILARMWEWDRKMIHTKYQAVVEQWKAQKR